MNIDNIGMKENPLHFEAQQASNNHTYNEALKEDVTHNIPGMRQRHGGKEAAQTLDSQFYFDTFGYEMSLSTVHQSFIREFAGAVKRGNLDRF